MGTAFEMLGKARVVVRSKKSDDASTKGIHHHWMLRSAQSPVCWMRIRRRDQPNHDFAEPPHHFGIVDHAWLACAKMHWAGSRCTVAMPLQTAENVDSLHRAA